MRKVQSAPRIGTVSRVKVRRAVKAIITQRHKNKKKENNNKKWKYARDPKTIK